ncbi:NAD(P)/FAD-dependent oxidoreductase [Luteibaculum oceani]|uniref:FAD-binding protein n=1 Tax=Luteibaculum oceani TaxID=1294296 RepID=A0A5C6UZ57_9FLAO|nr:FAD-binding protein [Luteibaculum oceani]TXC78547.1 FAD-binding protein [Luteibaculum oceani]
MAEIINLSYPAYLLENVDNLEDWLQKKFPNQHIRPLKVSLDARKKPIKYNIRAEISREPLHPEINCIQAKEVNKDAIRVLIVGFGPAGMFAALKCLELGLKPVIIERGKNVKERRRDLAAITKHHEINPDSNYCFGEGGAGTYSDGKLYTRSGKQKDIHRIFSTLVNYGAPKEIIYQAHPHIGTNKLPGLVEKIREDIINKGGEVHFNTKFLGLELEDNKIVGINTSKGSFKSNTVILATGHSARDIYYHLYEKLIEISPKPFAVGFRIEHPQSFINERQYKGETNIGLPPAAYSLVANKGESGIFSFCMCPGGIIAPCATEPGEIVTNGWSPSKRNNPLANAGIVTQVSIEELEKLGYSGPLAALEFQKSIEKKAGDWANGSQAAPAQMANDFIKGKKSEHLKETSYIPGVYSADFNKLYPKAIAERLKFGLKTFEKKMPGFLRENPMLVGPETRTSAPVRIPRGKDLIHPGVKGLIPCGEGAGYAGGIASAAMDGERCANAAFHYLTENM